MANQPPFSQTPMVRMHKSSFAKIHALARQYPLRRVCGQHTVIKHKRSPALRQRLHRKPFARIPFYLPFF